MSPARQRETGSNMLDRRDYTVAVICALPVELAAVQVMLDDEHQALPRLPNESNTYTLGRMGTHNVVIACLPSGIYGTISAAIVASELRFSFPSVKFGLLVGIAGGVPDKYDVRLGDVVVSQPSGTAGGVVQYDFGKTIQQGKFIMTGQLDRPPTVLLTALSQHQARHIREGVDFGKYIIAASQRFPEFRENCERPEQDSLFEAEYEHPIGELTCDLCDSSYLVNRRPRKKEGPVIHYGLIASGNQVMKHAGLRREFGRSLDVLCFEMEAAGLMNSFPCVAIRGICDYADSHKHKTWQSYAAVVAAAYARDLMDIIPLNAVEQTHSAIDTIEKQTANEVALYRPRSVNNINKMPVPKEEWEVVKGVNRDWPKLLSRLSDHDPEIAHWRLSKDRLPNTGKWFLEHPHVKRWLESPKSRSLWCSGGVGSGKTMLCTGLIDHIKSVPTERFASLIHFHCENAKRKTAEYLFRSLIKQLLEHLLISKRQCPEAVVTRIEQFFNPASPEPDFEDIKTIFLMLASTYSGAIFLIDGLDALEDLDVRAILYAFHHLLRRESGPKVFISSRDELGLNVRPVTDLRVRISSDDNELDIQQYIVQNIQMESVYGRPLSTNDETMTKIKQVLADQARGMFLWVRLQLEALWLDCINDEQIIAALDALPRDLPTTYDRCVTRMPPMTKDIGIKALRWVASSNRELNIHELQEAVSFDFTDKSWNPAKLIAPSILMASCANLITFDRDDQTVRLAHPTVKQYLFASNLRISSRLHFDMKRTVLECGEECVNYLSFLEFTSQVQKASLGNSQVRLSTPAAIADTLPMNRLASKVSGFFGSKGRTAKPTLPPLESWLRKPESREQVSYALLDYARQNWAPQTRQISPESKVWNKFVAIALQLGDPWEKQPWRSSTLSYLSHLHCLLIWAARERHVPLLDLVMKEGSNHGIKNFCDLPSVNDGLPALHIASRLGYDDIVKPLLKVCHVNALGPASVTPLHLAVEKDHEIIVYLLLSVDGIKLSSYRLRAPNDSSLGSTEVRETPLGIAALQGLEMMVWLLLKHDTHVLPDILPDEIVETNPLIAAAHGCHPGIFQKLLEKSVHRDIDKDNLMGAALNTALHNGCDEIVKLLLDQTKVNVNTVPGSHETPLSMAIAKGDLNSAALLLQCPRLDANRSASGTERTPLSHAAEQGYEPFVEQLLAKEASVDKADSARRTPLSYAAANGHVGVMRQLLDAGATPTQDEANRDPLSYAAENGHAAAIELLLNDEFRDFDRNLDGKRIFRLSLWNKEHYSDWRSPIALAAEGGHAAVVKTLIEHGADPGVKDIAGRNPLSYAAGAGQEAVVKLLLRNATSEDQDVLSRTPLSFAAEGGHAKVVKLLLDKNRVSKTDSTALSASAQDGRKDDTMLRPPERDDWPESIDSYGRTPISYAAANGHEAVVSLLLDETCKPGPLDGAKNVGLSYAAENGHEAIVRLLLNHGAHPDRQDSRRSRPLYYARRNGHEAIARLLIEHGANADTTAAGLLI